jgi:glycogen debranching enzyme
VDINTGNNFPKECIFLSSKKGGYFVLGSSAFSQYQGLFHFLPEEWELYKTVDNIYPAGVSDSPSIVMRDGFFERHTEHIMERFWITGKNLVYELHGATEVTLDLDFRRIHDYDDRGRIYSIYKEKDNLIVEYKKYSDNDLKNLVETKFLVINGVASFNPVNEWIKKNYDYDLSRGAKSELYIYKALSFIPTDVRTVFGFGSTKNEAINNASKKVNINISSLMQDTELSAAALNNLLVEFEHQKKEVTGIFAGYPWFYQFWGRDETIALIGLIANKHHDAAKKIIMRLVNNLDENGVLYNRWPKSDLKSADATCWLFKRIHQLIIESDKENRFIKLFSKKDLRLIYDKLCRYTDYSKSLMRDDLIINNNLETWMDTSDREGTDVRAGARIEIQALHISLYAIGEDLTAMLKENNPEFTILKNKLKDKTREIFFSDGILCDGYVDGYLDKTLRPNVFLAYYVCPNLFSHEEWKIIFNRTISACFLEWGGFTTIDKNHYLFRNTYTGINNESYHRGDSWFFINNIAATCMLHLDKHYFHEYIKKIRRASVTEMMHMGFMGQCAELSSAKELCSRGCLAQAWSAGTLIELLHEYHKE